MLDGMSGTNAQTPKPSAEGGFEETIKDFWASRPRRPEHGRKIAGVAAGLGNRYGLDPVIVRVGLAAATVFGGVGVLLYVLGWLFFADERDEVSAFESMIGKGRSSTSKGFTLALCIAVFPAASWTFAGGWLDGGGFIVLGLLAAGLYLLHRSRGHANRPLPPTWPAAEFGYPSAAYGTPFTESVPGQDGASSWDPLGASPLDWDLPGGAPPEPAAPPTPEPPAPRRAKSKVGPVTFVSMLAVGGTAVALALNGVAWFSPQHIVGLMLGVVGLGLVAGAFLRGGRGLIGLAVPLSVAGVALTVVSPTMFGGGIGTIDAVPHTAAEVQPVYTLTLGDVQLDLRSLPPEASVNTTVQTTVGSSEVLVPETADVTFTCNNTAGNTDCLGRTSEGVGKGPITGVDLGPDGAGGPKITLTANTSAGNVEVRRG